MNLEDYDDDADDFLGAVEGRRRHQNRPKRRPTTQTVLIQEDEEQ
ncbi:hypothetical protein [Brevibacterium sp. UCMA 11754]|nr:hypothetical protein [Brevibacterium sp. UCMA 11754]